ncbi:hypothetical protein EKK58_11820 [Candidatus Dependentiae bacterium]|nr:MAG: hypothetical protein EKK58_11820 [Candidatus Dependentiae bacterium]
MTEYTDLPIYTEVMKRDVSNVVYICMKLVWQQIDVVHRLMVAESNEDAKRSIDEVANIRDQIDNAVSLLQVLRGFLE